MMIVDKIRNEKIQCGIKREEAKMQKYHYSHQVKLVNISMAKKYYLLIKVK